MGENDVRRNLSLNADAKSKFWYVSFIGGDGRKKRRSTKVPVEGGLFKGSSLTKRQAYLIAFSEAEKIAEGERCAEGSRVNVSVKEFLFSYLERRREFISQATYVNMRGAYNNFCAFLGSRSSVGLALIRRDEAKGFVDFRRKEVRFASVKKDVTALVSAFNDALDSELIVRNPFSRMKIQADLAHEKLSHEAFSLEEIRFMVERFPSEWSSAVRCCFETFGQRLGDILSLRWRQFDFDLRVVNLTTGKTGKVLAQPMREGFYLWALNEFRSRGARLDDYVHPLLFRSRERASIDFGLLLRSFGIGELSDCVSGKRRRVNSKTFHCIRASCATLLQASGASMGLAMKLVGHDSEVVHAGYVRPDVEQLRRVAESMEGL